MNRLPKNNEIKESTGDFLYPILCMTSLEPVEVKEAFFDENDKPSEVPFFSVNFSCFKKEKEGICHLSFILSNLNVDVPPELVLDTAENENDQKAVQFLSSSLHHFEEFKKAVLLFEKKAYTYKEFDDTVTKWKESLKEVIE